MNKSLLALMKNSLLGTILCATVTISPAYAANPSSGTIAVTFGRANERTPSNRITHRIDLRLNRNVDSGGSCTARYFACAQAFIPADIDYSPDRRRCSRRELKSKVINPRSRSSRLNLTVPVVADQSSAAQQVSYQARVICRDGRLNVRVFNTNVRARKISIKSGRGASISDFYRAAVTSAR